MPTEPAVQVIYGLGNPGPKYEATRHNAGFWLLDELARRHAGAFRQEAKFAAEVGQINLAAQTVWLVKPQTYMNHSGRSVQAFNHFYRIPATSTLVVHDEIDLPPGRVRLKRGGGHGGHNGLRDIVAKIGAAFVRLRLGVGHPGERTKVIGYVLERPMAIEEQAIRTNIDQAIEVLPLVIQGELERAMTRLHTDNSQPG